MSMHMNNTNDTIVYENACKNQLEKSE